MTIGGWCPAVEVFRGRAVGGAGIIALATEGAQERGAERRGLGPERKRELRVVFVALIVVRSACPIFER